MNDWAEARRAGSTGPAVRRRTSTHKRQTQNGDKIFGVERAATDGQLLESFEGAQ